MPAALTTEDRIGPDQTFISDGMLWQYDVSQQPAGNSPPVSEAFVGMSFELPRNR